MAVARVGGVVLVPAIGQTVGAGAVGDPRVGDIAGRHFLGVAVEMHMGAEVRLDGDLARHGAFAAGIDSAYLVVIQGAEADASIGVRRGGDAGGHCGGCLSVAAQGAVNVVGNVSS